MRTNNLKAKLERNELAIGAVMQMPSPDLVEVSAAIGYDFVTIDTEHVTMSHDQVVHMIRAADGFNVTPIVRVPKDPNLVLPYLDAGAQGIHVPHCNSAADAMAMVECTRFHPQGKRTFFALGRSANFAVDIDDQQWSQAANRELLLIAMIEEEQALNNLPEILEVPHLDIIHIGHRDLWQSMGMPRASVVDEAIAHITASAVSSGKRVSVTLRLTDDVHDQIAKHVRRGVQMFTMAPLNFILRHGRAFIARAREAQPAASQ